MNNKKGFQAQYFKQSEFACKCGCGFDDINPKLVYMLDRARSMAKLPFIITSGCRCKQHNTSVGGVLRSPHLEGLAADISVTDDPTRSRILVALVLAGFERIGIGADFIHVDIRKGTACWLY